MSPPLKRLADCCAVFLDFDGTLTDLADRPDGVVVDAELLSLLKQLHGATGGATAVISGRSMDTLDTLLDPLRLPLGGIHGAERRRADATLQNHAVPEPLVAQLRSGLNSSLQHYAGLLVEDKGCAFAVHYREAAPDVPTRLRADMQRLADDSAGVFELLEGRDVFELRPQTCDKGTALESFMNEQPFTGRSPIFIGDDQTDRAGFEAATRLGGMAIAVGPRVTAQWWLPDPAGVRAWLRGCLAVER